MELVQGLVILKTLVLLYSIVIAVHSWHKQAVRMHLDDWCVGTQQRHFVRAGNVLRKTFESDQLKNWKNWITLLGQ